MCKLKERERERERKKERERTTKESAAVSFRINVKREKLNKNILRRLPTQGDRHGQT